MTSASAAKLPRSIRCDRTAAWAALAGHYQAHGRDLVLDRLSPRSLGALLALYEHRVFTSGVLWGIDSFDQWGVELGKSMSARLLDRLELEALAAHDQALDASTAGLLQRLRC